MLNSLTPEQREILQREIFIKQLEQQLEQLRFLRQYGFIDQPSANSATSSQAKGVETKENQGINLKTDIK